ncbi:putative exocyst complex component [Phaeomoniella chlamydospora]|uniref:Putative exocyst complex component n=1 Tax=Phaeomoniella chlamydospora TaxID=158046 RepID=A0A0G2EMW7_PHACM|nr:putative exocyst complex component [Phaeomoniella chlamydospora]
MADSTDLSDAAQAQKFDNEKRRIIDSCFSKKSEDGTPIETYITHIRVVEDGVYTSTPPPPNSPPANKKPRTIIVAVRKSGKVRVHKARENNNGTFSIGKTWEINDLGPVKSFSVVTPSDDPRLKEWAGDTGFVVTLGKPYYWQANAYKAKQFFIESLVKIYRKYTGGLLPELQGFSPEEEQRLVAKARAPSNPAFRSPPAPRTPSNPFPPPAPSTGSAQSSQVFPPSSAGSDYNRAPSRSGVPSPAVTEDGPPSRRDVFRAPSRDDMRAPSRNGASPLSSRENMPPASRDGLRAPSREGYREMRRQPSREQMMRKMSSEDPIPRMPGQFAPSMPQRDMTPESVQQPLEKATALRQGTNGTSASPATQKDEVLRRLRGGSDVLSTDPERGSERPRRSGENQRKSPSPRPSPDRLPERRRPPFQNSVSGQKSTESVQSTKYFTPIATPDQRLMEDGENSRQAPKTPNDLPTDGVKSLDYFARSKMEGTRGKDNEMEATSVQPAPSVKAITTEDKASEGQSEIVPETPTSPLSDTNSEEHRPGLGPMIKKKSAKDIAGTFRKAALAAAAFKPRAGGAGERLLAQKEINTNEPDGITSVVPAPLLRGISNDSTRPTTPNSKDIITSPVSDNSVKSPFSSKKQANPTATPPIIQVQRKATEDIVQVQAEEKPKRPSSPDKARSRSPGRRRRQMQEARIAKYCNALDIDPKVLESRGGDFDDLLTELGWDGKLEEGKTVDDLQADIRREIGRAQATGWLGHIEQQETKTQQLATLFDKAIAECEELDGLLTLYQHELSTLADDVAYIEAQGQGLQVQTANQKLLQTEVRNLLRTISISPEDLRDLREASLGTPDGLDAAEQALAVLYKAMLTIDPDIRQNRKRQADAGHEHTGVGVYADAELGQMRAVTQKKDDYRDETQLFLKRLNQYMTMAFKIAEQRTSDYLEQNKSGLGGIATRLDTRVYDVSRNELWMYNALMLFVREVNSYEWQTLISMYESSTKSVYQDQFRDNVFAWKKMTRKPTGDEQDILFTGQEKEKEGESLATAARKLTVKRGKTVRVGNLRQSTGERQDGRVEPFEAFSGVMDEQLKCIAEEQNFSVEFFHLNSLSTADFADIVAAAPPDKRKLPNLSAKHNYDPDRDMAKMVEKVMDNLYSFWPQDMQNLIDWVLRNDQLQGVGLLYVIEKKLSDYEETNQEYITRTLQRIHDRLVGLFHRFVDEQIRGIEDTKVKIKKRRGVISFMRVFPSFSGAVEGMISSATSDKGHHESLEIRFIVNEAYGKINKAMFESLIFIAKENPAVAAAQGANGVTSTGDPEDKEALNYHILMIENMNHYIEEVDTKNNIVLDEWHEKATHEFYDHMRQYIDAVIRRPLGKLLDFIESTESLMKSYPSEASYPSIAAKPSHSRSTAKKVIAAYDLKEIRKGIDTLKKRIEKHFGDADDPGVGRSIVTKVFGECSARYVDAHDRMRRILEKVYEGQGGGLDLEWRKEEASAMFRR